MASTELSALFADLFGVSRAQNHAAVQACLDAYEHPTGNMFAVPTSTLSKVLRSLKGRLPTEKRAAAEEAFMKLVTKVRRELVTVHSARKVFSHAALSEYAG
jgi:hypothetical protein